MEHAYQPQPNRAPRAARLAVISDRMRSAPAWMLPTLVQCWLREVAR